MAISWNQAENRGLPGVSRGSWAGKLEIERASLTCQFNESTNTQARFEFALCMSRYSVRLLGTLSAPPPQCCASGIRAHLPLRGHDRQTTILCCLQYGVPDGRSAARATSEVRCPHRL